MKNFIGKYQQQERENQVFLGKKLEIQVNLFIQGFNCQEQMTFYYLNALGMWEYNERNFDKVLMQACVKISYLLYNAHQLLLTYIIHSGFISGYQNRYGDNLKPPTNVYHRMTA